MLPDVSKRLQMAPDASRWLPDASNKVTMMGIGRYQDKSGSDWGNPTFVGMNRQDLATKYFKGGVEVELRGFRGGFFSGFDG